MRSDVDSRIAARFASPRDHDDDASRSTGGLWSDLGLILDLDSPALNGRVRLEAAFYGGRSVFRLAIRASSKPRNDTCSLWLT
jgi:hypothetical protein